MLEELMVGMKRSLVLTPMMRLDAGILIADPAKVLLSVVMAHKPPPEIIEPPMWRSKWAGWARITETVVGVDGTWPPKNIKPKKDSE
jgi:hypothetical protein